MFDFLKSGAEIESYMTGTICGTRAQKLHFFVSHVVIVFYFAKHMIIFVPRVTFVNVFDVV